MDVQKQNETCENLRYMQGFYSNVTNGFSFSPDALIAGQQETKSNISQLDKSKRLKLAIDELQIGQRIQKELKQQGRTVSWLARQLGMERTNLYYIFRQNSIDVKLLLCISFYLNHNFLQDLNEVFKAYGLL